MRMEKRSMALFTVLVHLALSGCALQPGLYGLDAELTEQEKSEPEAKYYTPVFAPLPPEVEEALAEGPVDPGRALRLADIKDLIKPGYLAVENGYCVNPDRTGFVAVKTDMPGVTADMIQWWFWWHAEKDIRYKIWCPGDHYAISVKNRDQADDTALSYEQRRVNNTHYPYEDTGTGVFQLSIRFVPPETLFGCDPTKDSATNGIEAVVCAVVGYKVGMVTVEHTYMTHVFRRTPGGLELRSRFWPGSALKSEGLRKMTIDRDVVKGLAYHCAREFSHLAGFLPEIYQEMR